MINYKSINLVICDSAEAIKFAWKKGLPKTIPILTQSPSLCMNKKFNTIQFESKKKNNYFYNSGEYVSELSRKIDKVIKKDKNYPLYRSLIFASFANTKDGANITNIIAKLKFIKKFVYRNKNILIIKLKTKNKVYENRYNFPWDLLFDSKKVNFKILKYDIQEKQEDLLKHTLSLNSVLNIFNIFSVQKMKNIFYKFSLLLFNNTIFKPKKYFALLVDNPISREAAINLVLKGYGITKLKDPKELKLEPTDTLENKKKINQIIKITEPVLNKFLKNNIHKIFQEGLKKIILERMKFFLLQNQISINYWDNIFKKNNKNICGVLSNTTGHPATRSLYSYCLLKKIPFFLFQHGSSIELTKINETRDYICETTFCDIFFVYSKIFKKISFKNKFSVSKIVHVGVPVEYHQGKKKSIFKKSEFLYVSTLVYAGNVKFAENDTDNKMAEFEMNLIEKVFSSSNNKFVYKYYPQINVYLDKDPILKKLNECPNIQLFKKNLNLREICSEFKVIITSRGTSTLFWCIWLNKPIVFIDMPNSKPLRNDAKKALKQYLFYFDYSDKNFYSKITKFLEKGTEEIYSLFLKKKLKNKKIVDEYFKYYPNKAGKRTAETIVNYIKKK